MGTTLMRPDARKHVWAIYAWCRRTDDIVDSPRALLNRDVLMKDLTDWENRLERVWNNKPCDLFDMAMADTVQTFPKMDIQPYKDMIKGMVMDVPDLGQDRYKNFEELYLYCYRVAGTVGLMTLPILGTAEGFTAGTVGLPTIPLLRSTNQLVLPMYSNFLYIRAIYSSHTTVHTYTTVETHTTIHRRNAIPV
jgi:phytoene synthase